MESVPVAEIKFTDAKIERKLKGEISKLKRECEKGERVVPFFIE